jgi:hypothetical protein
MLAHALKKTCPFSPHHVYANAYHKNEGICHALVLLSSFKNVIRAVALRPKPDLVKDDDRVQTDAIITYISVICRKGRGMNASQQVESIQCVVMGQGNSIRHPKPQQRNI